ncbi:5975_t:CDS:2 [Entrophospora sp. SA101]|nr:7825_t:CDS:2 [Entrophospora sp. SA101]CAJ0844027.1 5975_t:CDS:2 [Entrophospora sp. SA101]
MNNNTDTNNIDTNNIDNSESAKRVKNEKQQQATKTIKLQALLPRRRHHHPLEPKIENELDFPMSSDEGGNDSGKMGAEKYQKERQERIKYFKEIDSFQINFKYDDTDDNFKEKNIDGVLTVDDDSDENEEIYEVAARKSSKKKKSI